jgi:hypothetical protein
MGWREKAKRKDPREKTTYLPALPVPTDPITLKWGIVSTIKAPIKSIARFIAWHLDAGSAHIHIHLDVPDQSIAYRLAHPKVTFTQCDDAYWATAPDKARQSHQLRQAYNATRSYRASNMDWLAHIDVDEFLLSPTPLSERLAGARPDAAFVRLHPVELMANQSDPFNETAYFKRTRKHVKQRKAVLETIYPNFGAYVPEGFISYSGGKNITRTGIPDARIGIHATMYNGVPLSNGELMPDIAIGHAHAPDWATFKAHFEYRMSKGSYRKKSSESGQLNDVLSLITAEEGDIGLRQFFDEMCLATPERLDLLRAHDMLLTWRLDLDEKVQRYFGNLEGA